MTEPETPERIFQRVLDERGYLVVFSLSEYRPKDVIRGSHSLFGPLDYPLHVLGETDYQDFVTQVRLVGAPEANAKEFPQARYYRVTCE